MNFDITSGINFNLIIFFSVFFISIIGTKLVILSLRNKISDPDIALITGKRKAPIPKNGGFAMVFAIIAGFLCVEVDYVVIAPIFFLAGLPLLDSIMPLPKLIKLAIRAAAVALALHAIPLPIFSELFPPLFDKALAGFLWLWIIHSFDKMEVVEGLVPIEMISIGLGLSSLSLLLDNFFSPVSIQSVIFACSGIGFWWWNHHPAKVLAGEIARVPAGFVAGYLLILAASSGYSTAAFILPAYFLADSFVVFFNRPFSEKLVSDKDAKPQTPYCLRAIKNSYAPQWIVRTITGINMLLIFLEAQTLISPQMMMFNLVLAYAMVFTLVWYFARKNTVYHI